MLDQTSNAFSNSAIHRSTNASTLQLKIPRLFYRRWSSSSSFCFSLIHRAIIERAFSSLSKFPSTFNKREYSRMLANNDKKSKCFPLDQPNVRIVSLFLFFFPLVCVFSSIRLTIDGKLKVLYYISAKFIYETSIENVCSVFNITKQTIFLCNWKKKSQILRKPSRGNNVPYTDFIYLSEPIPIRLWIFCNFWNSNFYTVIDLAPREINVCRGQFRSFRLILPDLFNKLYHIKLTQHFQSTFSLRLIEQISNYPWSPPPSEKVNL